MNSDHKPETSLLVQSNSNSMERHQRIINDNETEAVHHCQQMWHHTWLIKQ